MNTVTARTRGVTRAYMESLARELGQYVAGTSSVRMEIALTLPVPQTADCALLRLCDHAPSQSAGGAVFEAWLLTHDKDLIERVTELFDRAGVSLAGRLAAGVNAFRGSARGDYHRRRFAPRTRAIGAPTEPTEPAFSVDIDTGGLAVWAANREIDLAPDELELDATARAVETRPGVLSQIGITKQCVTGVERMVRLPAHRSLAPCAPDEGIEVRFGPAPAGMRARLLGRRPARAARRRRGSPVMTRVRHPGALRQEIMR